MRIEMKWTLVMALLLTAACGSGMTTTDMIPAKGNRLGGENVTIRGTGFNDGAVVRFAGIEASTTFIGETELQVVTPGAAAGKVAVTVTNPDGTSADIASGFEFFGATLTFIDQNGFRMVDGNTVVYIDAFHAGYDHQADDADLILITHDMTDHFSTARVTAAAQASGAIVVGPEAVISWLRGESIDDQLVAIEGISYGQKMSGTYAGIEVDSYFTEHIGQGGGYDHMSYRVELGGMVIFLPGDMTSTNWTGPLADYPELVGMDLAMGSSGFVNLGVLDGQDPAVIVEVHLGNTCRVYSDYPDSPVTVSTEESFTIPM